MMEFSREHKKTDKMRELITARKHSVFDPLFTKALKEIPWAEWLEIPGPFLCREEFIFKMHGWIMGSQLNSVCGLERFTARHLIIGTTQSFDEFYLRYAKRRLRVFRGEYAYHGRILKNSVFLEDSPLDRGDYIILSMPFAATGEIHPRMMDILDQALLLEVPVLIDSAYFGTCADIAFDYRHPAIESVSFSLTKGLGMGDMRCGVRYSFYEDDFPIAQQNKYNHTVLASAKIGIYMMEKFSADHIPNRFRETQREVCAELGLSPSRCMHIAIGDSSWDHLQTDGLYNSLGLRDLIKARTKKIV